MALIVRVYEYRDGPLKRIITDLLDDQAFQVTYELDRVASGSLTLPAYEFKYFTERSEVEVTDGKGFLFRGLTDTVQLDKENETISVPISQVLTEWDFHQVPVNINVKNSPISSIYPSTNFSRTLWSYIFEGTTSSRSIEYLFSSQSKLQALNDVLNQTPDLHFRHQMDSSRVLEIGDFGKDKGYIMSASDAPSDGLAVQIIQEPIFTYEPCKINQIEVFAGNVSNGMAQITMRDINDSLALQDSSFPVTPSSKPANTELTYGVLDAVQIAPNNNLSYIITDVDSLSLESGEIYEGSVQFNDLYPTPQADSVVTNSDRIEMTKRAYYRGIRTLKDNRRKTDIEVSCGYVNNGLLVGDAVRLKYYNSLLLEQANCDKLEKKETILDIDQKYFVLSRTITFSADGSSTNKFILSDQLTKLKPITNLEVLVLQKLATQENTNQHNEEQRKSSVHDTNGQEHTATGQKNQPAEIYFSVSEDWQYFLQWDFRFILTNVEVVVSGSAASVTLTVNQQPSHTLTLPEPIDHTINLPAIDPHVTPLTAPLNHNYATGTNPVTASHSYPVGTNPIALSHVPQLISPSSHSHSVITGSSVIASSAENLEVWVDGFNLTPFFQVQYPLGWPVAPAWTNGIFPGTGLTDRFDIKEAALAAGNPAKDVILSSGLHKIEFRVNPTGANQAVFSVKMLNYLQISHLVR
jgi:hypothetical protein